MADEPKDPGVAGEPQGAESLGVEEMISVPVGGVVVARVMPWVISVLLHVGLALIMIFMTMIVIRNTIPPDVIVPNPVWSKNPGQMRPADAMEKSESETTRKQDRRTKASEQIDKDTRPLAVVAPGAAMQGAERFGASMGLSSNDASTSFMGSGGSAYNIVYVIDRSGSMLETFETVRYEMLLSIGKLRDFQEFHVILFADGPPIEFTAKRLVEATKTNREAVAAFLADARSGVRPMGQTDPIPAIQRAFQVLRGAKANKPGRLIHLLTDGEFPDPDRTVRVIREANRKHDVYVNTFLYGYQPDKGRDVLKKIAQENGGEFKYIPPE